MQDNNIYKQIFFNVVLMSQQKFSLENFVGSYVSCAFEQFEIPYGEDIRIRMEVFEERLRRNVGNDLKISEETILHLHHAFHWAFFCNNGGNGILECYYDTKLNRTGFWIRAKKAIIKEDMGKMAADILEKYRDYLSERAKTIPIS